MIRDDGLKKRIEKSRIHRGKYDPCQHGDFLELPVYFLGLLKRNIRG